MGADEIYFGYRRQKATLMAANYRKLPGFIRKIISATVNLLPVKIGGKGIKLTRWAKRFLKFADLPIEESYMKSYSYYEKRNCSNCSKPISMRNISGCATSIPHFSISSGKGTLSTRSVIPISTSSCRD